VKDKLLAALFCLIFAGVFGGVGVFATWMIAATIHDGMRAQDWVRVKAYVESLEGSEVRYRYTFQGRDYSGGRLGASPVGGSDNIDDWSADLQHRLAAAKAEKHPITVLVDPEKPSDSMIDARIRWNFLVFLLPFSLAFGAVGAGALYALTGVLRGKGDKSERRGPVQRDAGIASDARVGIIGLWVFAFFWDVISFPIALLFVPQLINDGEWMGLFVVLFPLIGLFLVWTAAKATWAYLRRGGATLKLRDDNPRIGSHVEGTVDFARGVKPGDTFYVNLLCRRSVPQGDETSVSTRWTKRVDARATNGPGGARIAFHFEVPAHLPATSEASGADRESFQWRIEVNPANQPLPIPHGFDLEMRAAPREMRSVAFAGDEMPATLGPGFEGVEKLLGLDTSRMSDGQRAALAAMTPEQKAALGKIAGYAPLAKKVAVVVFVAIFVIPFLIAVIPMLIALFTSS
jgi:hypothetical protein